MKTIKFITTLTVLALISASCVEKSGKYQALLAERDSLQTTSAKLETGYNETLDLLNDVEEGFASIRALESKMVTDVNGIEGKSASKKQQIAAQINQIKKTLEQNKGRIEQLQRLAGERGKQNSTLSATIKRMENEMAEKTTFIASLQEELSKKNIQITELTTTVEELNNNIGALKDETEQQKTTIKTQDSNLHAVWYSVATAKQLKEAQILSGNGLFRAKTILDKSFNSSSFKQADQRELTSIATNSKKAKILTSHPQDSYSLEKGEDNLITIKITNSEKFWSISKYLVVQK
ncbi:MAG: hypothetical protein QM751_00395 [Paludibacteraceae bacterium]